MYILNSFCTVTKFSIETWVPTLKNWNLKQVYHIVTHFIFITLKI